LINKDLIPKNLELQIRVFNFTKYLKKYRKVTNVYVLDEISINFLEKFLPDVLNLVETKEEKIILDMKAWDKVYQSQMDVARDWLREHQTETLEKYNQALFLETWEKYAKGTLSHWEMESLCFYHGDHELKDVNVNKYGLADFNKLQSCEVDYYFKRNGREIPIYKLYRIIGTVIAKNDTKHIVSLLTTSGVVSVKFTKDYYAMFKKQISQIQEDGTKKVVEKSWFKRGTLLMITGFRRDDMFVGKTYANTEGHQLYKITEINGDSIKLQHERFSSDGALREDDYDD
jgi:DNA polymerase-3 subunit alpha